MYFPVKGSPLIKCKNEALNFSFDRFIQAIYFVGILKRICEIPFRLVRLVTQIFVK